jgi:5-(carboxyamino)imidazole ribonucleotide mutase
MRAGLISRMIRNYCVETVQKPYINLIRKTLKKYSAVSDMFYLLLRARARGYDKITPNNNLCERGTHMKKVGIVMGSASDMPVATKVTTALELLEIPYEMHIYSAHRTPKQARDFAANARENGFGVLIGIAGMAAHLAGALAANTILPVIGIPCKSTNLDGLDALLATVQMPSGIPVATVAIDGGTNAALLAAQILSVEDAELAQKLIARREQEAQAVLDKDAAL